MQQVSIDLGHYDFFCPVTGEQVLMLGEYHASSATKAIMFSHFSGTVYIDEKIDEAYKEALEKGELPTEYDEPITIEEYIEQMDEEDWVMFTLEMSSLGPGGGPVGWEAGVVIDMNYPAR